MFLCGIARLAADARDFTVIFAARGDVMENIPVRISSTPNVPFDIAVARDQLPQKRHEASVTTSRTAADATHA
jgi:hypothetical protein